MGSYIWYRKRRWFGSRVSFSNSHIVAILRSIRTSHKQRWMQWQTEICWTSTSYPSLCIEWAYIYIHIRTLTFQTTLSLFTGRCTTLNRRGNYWYSILQKLFQFWEGEIPEQKNTISSPSGFPLTTLLDSKKNGIISIFTDFGSLMENNFHLRCAGCLWVFSTNIQEDLVPGVLWRWSSYVGSSKGRASGLKCPQFVPSWCLCWRCGSNSWGNLKNLAKKYSW